MTPLKIAMTVAALAVSAPGLAMSKPDPQQANGLPKSANQASSSSEGVIDVSSPSSLLLLGLAAGGVLLGRRGRK